MRIEIGVQHPAAVDAVARLQAALGVIEAGMDHFGVARGRVHRDLVLGLEDDHFAPRPRQRAPAREANDARANDHHVCLETVRHVPPKSVCSCCPLAEGLQRVYYQGKCVFAA